MNFRDPHWHFHLLLPQFALLQAPSKTIRNQHLTVYQISAHSFQFSLSTTVANAHTQTRTAGQNNVYYWTLTIFPRNEATSESRQKPAWGGLISKKHSSTPSVGPALRGVQKWMKRPTGKWNVAMTAPAQVHLVHSLCIVANSLSTVCSFDHPSACGVGWGYPLPTLCGWPFANFSHPE